MRIMPFVIFLYGASAFGCGKSSRSSAASDDGFVAVSTQTNSPAAPEKVNTADKEPKAEENESEENIPKILVADVSADSQPPLGTPFILEQEGLKITKLILARGYEKTEKGTREVLDPGYVFQQDNRRVYIILDFDNPQEVSTELTVGWIRPGSTKEGNSVSLSVVNRKTWRTFAYNGYVNTASGIWQVIIRDSNNKILARASFEMVNSEQPTAL